MAESLVLPSEHKKVLDIYQNEGHLKAWNYWKLVGNTYGVFLGEVPSHEFINGETLAHHIGLTEGELCNSDTPWLKFLLDYEIIYVPMKPLMQLVSWEEIYQCGAVYARKDFITTQGDDVRLQDANITIGTEIFDITLLRGGNTNHDKVYIGYDLVFTHNSEWNRLMYPIHSGVHTDENNPDVPSTPYTQWATYSDADLALHYYYHGNASITWTRETSEYSGRIRFGRGCGGVTCVEWSSDTDPPGCGGWRPALRLRKS